MGKCLVTKLNANVDLGNNFKVFGYGSSFDADSEKNAIFGIDHARVRVFGTSEPCVNNNTQEVLGTEFCKEYAAAKKKEWLRYTREISAWEIEEYFYRI